ncbi:Rossmann-like domain-containing protein [Dethiosulfatarculus sandiegensis]|uniref:Membrane protein n=1 Tax=Dethiosulfatarculus sandiegensis TaxID=1429043 RepID=A0A0D2HRE4_9BACT|nr:DUF364 domain-containing protein [Dethiosulfatarculus sandiegensis]KIX13133.1 membrane protein [Dethiosulfatarculus sandiegensis]
MDTYEKLRQTLIKTMESENWAEEKVQVKVRTLTPEEAIGDPEHRDYPLIKGRERMMAAEFRGCQGQAFTDRFGEFQGSLQEVANMELSNNFRRAVFLASLNAVLRAHGKVEKTIHCKDEAPPNCAAQLAEMVAERFGNPKVALVGLQPRMAQALATRFELRITDMDQDNIGQKRFGVVVESEKETASVLDWCDLALVTGTTFSNASVTSMLNGKPVIFYGVTVAGPAAALGLDRFCPLAS